ncbi:hypothetical protein GS966_05705 [Rhodococcus hoagii]|nr:hypothetical protein [Prescottella equi]NKZ89426.1 hypothetical protein [Prescottella equi]
MTMLISRIRAAEPLGLCSYANALGAATGDFSAAISDMSRAVDDACGSWQGDAAAAASLRALDEKLAGNHVETAVLALADTCGDVGRRLDELRTAVLSIVDGEARAEWMAVADDGTVTAPTMYSANPIIDALAQKQFDDSAAWMQSRIRGLLGQLDAVDDQGATAIAERLAAIDALRSAPDGAPVGAKVQAILDGRGELPSDPAQLDTLWRALSPTEKDALFEHDPFLGNRDGISHLDRDHYNRLNLQSMQERALREGDGDRAAELDGISKTLVAADGQPRRFLSLLDAEGHVAVALNNPDTAPNVTTYVPGTGSGLGSLDSDVARAQTMYKQATFSGAPASTSVITWLGYTAPPEIPDAAGIGYADRGAPALDGFQDGLRVTHDGERSHNVVLGHSYGTTLVGTAASQGRTLDADALVFVASPGTSVNHVTDLSLTGISGDEIGDHVFSTKSARDPVPLFADTHRIAVRTLGSPGAAWAAFDKFVEGHDGGPFGVDPTRADFGGRAFTSDAGPAGPLLGYNTDAHSDYWDYNPDGSPSRSLRNMALVIAGRSEDLT